MQSDPRLVWVMAEPGRKVVQTIEPTPQGWSVTTQWVENDQVKRQDCEIALRRSATSLGTVASFLKRVLGG